MLSGDVIHHICATRLHPTQRPFQPSIRKTVTSQLFGAGSVAYEFSESAAPSAMPRNRLQPLGHRRCGIAPVTGHMLACVPCSGAALACTEDGRRLYVFGGNDGARALNDVYFLDMEKLAWNPVPVHVSQRIRIHTVGPHDTDVSCTQGAALMWWHAPHEGSVVRLQSTGGVHRILQAC